MLVLGNPPKAATVKLEVMVLDVLLDSIQSGSCSLLVVGHLLFRISVVGHHVISLVDSKCASADTPKSEAKKLEYDMPLLDMRVQRCDDDVVRPRMYERMKWV